MVVCGLVTLNLVTLRKMQGVHPKYQYIKCKKIIFRNTVKPNETSPEADPVNDI